MLLKRRFVVMAIVVSFAAVFFVQDLNAQTRLSRNLSLGSSGDDVSALQQYLQHTGDYTGEITGNYDEVTQDAVQKWQCAQNIVCSGTPSTTGYGNLGPRTRATLIAVTTGGDVDEIYAELTKETIPPPSTSAQSSTSSPVPATSSLSTQSTVAPSSSNSSNTGDISLGAFVELLIALDVISADKVQVARDFAKDQGQNASTQIANNTPPAPSNIDSNTSVSSTASGVASRVLLLGMRGQDVIEVQLFLKKTGDYTYPEITGYFGRVTEDAVKQYQRRTGIVSSGTPATTGYGAVGPKTLSFIEQGIGTDGNTTSTIGVTDAEVNSTEISSGLTAEQQKAEEEAKASRVAQDKSLAQRQGEYAQSYYQSGYYSQSSYYGQAYYQSYYQGGYIAQAAYATFDDTPTSEVVHEADGTLVLPTYVHLVKSGFNTVNSTYSASTVNTIFNALTGVNEHYWKQGKIRWDLKGVQTHTVTNGADETYNQAYQNNDATTARTAIPGLASEATLQDGFNIFIVRDFSAFSENGIYYSSGSVGSGITFSDGVVFVSEINNAVHADADINESLEYISYLISHELGHALGLGHVSGTTNMMVASGSAFFTDEFGKKISIDPLDRNILTQSQINEARVQAETGQRGVPPSN
ncbi:hypothetical protein COU13_00555 [Candidatus Kaiserbacteria bacterium CG10_big_fil_rev_8_21_14_0_10_43_70]|uniref:Peptidoglycan binding-like domain-containing protein n=1 Tax=Candidatus Kaiserbacteria bacterium CG10_big_fil_rev_8_21_14_0_10_43_70 TaxID=1974605 RepID=A0A2H0UJC9_9BACT|nr:MAG: hypothetical protein COU13_00555 [Candidatus Kaiserbacteria bacterium CG10_big_fil_rev_8_21_14_0_10_43_70]